MTTPAYRSIAWARTIISRKTPLQLEAMFLQLCHLSFTGDEYSRLANTVDSSMLEKDPTIDWTHHESH